MRNEHDDEAVLEAFVGAIRSHFDALRRHADEGPDVDEVVDVWRQLRRAAQEYEDLLYERFDEITPWDVLEEDDDEVDIDPDDFADLPAAETETIVVMARFEYEVTDVPALVAHASDNGPEELRDKEPPSDPAELEGLDVARAMYFLIEPEGTPFLELDDAPGLEPVGGTLSFFAADEPIPPSEWNRPSKELFVDVEGLRELYRSTSHYRY